MVYLLFRSRQSSGIEFRSPSLIDLSADTLLVHKRSVKFRCNRQAWAIFLNLIFLKNFLSFSFQLELTDWRVKSCDNTTWCNLLSLARDWLINLIDTSYAYLDTNGDYCADDGTYLFIPVNFFFCSSKR